MLTPATDEGSAPAPTAWKSCCFTLDKEMAQFLVTTTVSLTVLGYCLAGATRSNGDERATYMSLVTFILGIYCPAPRPRPGAA